MKIVLLRPPALMKTVSTTGFSTAPLGLAFIAAALRNAGHRVSVIDCIAEKYDQFIPFADDILCHGLSIDEILERIPEDTEVVGLSIMFTHNWLNDRKIIDAIGEKFPHVRIIAGGEHITGLPEICFSHCVHLDVCVMGEGEETVVELIKAFENNDSLRSIEGIVFRDENGELVTTPRRKRIRDIEEIIWPAWDLFPLHIYKAKSVSFGFISDGFSLPILATRGCPYTCTFCTSPNMWGTRYFMRSPDDLLEEVKFLKDTYGVTNFDFYDLTAILNKHWIIETAQKLIDQKINITWQIPAGTRSEVIDAEVADYLCRSGCRYISYAPESGSLRILNLIKKRVSLPKMLGSIRGASRKGLHIRINIIIGFPEETHKDVWLTLLFLVKAAYNGANDTFPSIFQPYTGCEQFNTLLKEGRIKPEEDSYYYKLLDTNNFFGGNYYNRNIRQFWLKTYRFLYFSVFYGSTWILRPRRFFRLVRNMATQNFENKSEMTLHALIIGFLFKKNSTVQTKPTLPVKL